MIGQLMMYLQFSFVRNALIVGVLISICTALLGTILVLRRFSFIGDGLSHVAFGAMAIASIANLSNRMIIVIPVTVVMAIFLLRNGGNSSVKGDAALALTSVTALAFGYLMMNLFPVSGNISADVCTTLFGSTSILTLSRSDVALCMVMSLSVIAIFVIFFNYIFAVTFDEEFSKVCGVDTEKMNLVIAVIIGLVVVLAMNLVGSLLISALLVFPVLSAMRLFDSFKAVSICALIISLISSLAGMIVSVLLSTPVGSTIVALNAFVFVLASLAERIRK